MLTQSACVYSKQVIHSLTKGDLSASAATSQRPVVHTRNSIAALVTNDNTHQHEDNSRQQSTIEGATHRIDCDNRTTKKRKGTCGTKLILISVLRYVYFFPSSSSRRILTFWDIDLWEMSFEIAQELALTFKGNSITRTLISLTSRCRQKNRVPNYP